MQFCQHQCISSVGLDPVACLDRNQRGRDDDAIMPQPAQQSTQAVTAVTGLITEVQATPTTRQSLN
jgi:hypothetical protein